MACHGTTAFGTANTPGNPFSRPSFNGTLAWHPPFPYLGHYGPQHHCLAPLQRRPSPLTPLSNGENHCKDPQTHNQYVLVLLRSTAPLPCTSAVLSHVFSPFCPMVSLYLRSTICASLSWLALIVWAHTGQRIHPLVFFTTCDYCSVTGNSLLRLTPSNTLSLVYPQSHVGVDRFRIVAVCGENKHSLIYQVIYCPISFNLYVTCHTQFF
jgi:hypothetical protein